jgi:hypothetical protein
VKRLLLLALALASCGDDRVAGKTTTTGNGLIPVDETGTVIVGARARASSGWDTLSASPTDTVELRQSSDGTILLDGRPWAFVEVRSPDGGQTALVRRPTTEGTARLVLEPTDTLDLRWIDHAQHPEARAVVESSFVSGPVGSAGDIALAGAFGPLAKLILETGTGSILPAGTILDGSLVQSSLNFVDGSSPQALWIDDFEGVGGKSRLAQAWPGTSGWTSFLRNATATDPPVAGPLAAAVGPNGPGGSRALSFSFSFDSTSGWAAAQLLFPIMDLRSRGRFCLEFRSQGRVKVEFLRSTTTGASGFAVTIPASSAWKDTCLAIRSFSPANGNPPADSTWASFADSVRVLQVLALPNATSLGLDNLRFDPTEP